jgi:hypothetical protein
MWRDCGSGGEYAANGTTTRHTALCKHIQSVTLARSHARTRHLQSWHVGALKCERAETLDELDHVRSADGRIGVARHAHAMPRTVRACVRVSARTIARVLRGLRARDGVRTRRADDEAARREQLCAVCFIVSVGHDSNARIYLRHCGQIATTVRIVLSETQCLRAHVRRLQTHKHAHLEISDTLQ